MESTSSFKSLNYFISLYEDYKFLSVNASEELIKIMNVILIENS